MFIPMPDFKPRPLSEILKECASSPNAFNYWFGPAKACNVLTPETVSFDLEPQLQVDILDNLPMSPASQACLDALVKQLQDMGHEHGYPLFIKTSFTSAKHYYADSCCLPNGEQTTVLKHLSELIHFQVMCVGQSLSPSLVIRKMIETDPVFFAFEGMPVTEEYRFFTRDGKVEGYQPYWPEESIQNPSCEDWAEKLKTIKQPSKADVEYMSSASERIAAALKEQDWSIDFLRGKDGRLWLIDMAVASQSYRNVAEFWTLAATPESESGSEGPSL